MRDVEVQPALVHPFTLAEREQVELIVVVGDDGDVSLDRRAVDLDPEWRAVPGEEGERAQAGQRLSAAAMALAPVDEVAYSRGRRCSRMHVR